MPGSGADFSVCAGRFCPIRAPRRLAPGPERLAREDIPRRSEPAGATAVWLGSVSQTRALARLRRMRLETPTFVPWAGRRHWEMRLFHRKEEHRYSARMTLR